MPLATGERPPFRPWLLPAYKRSQSSPGGLQAHSPTHGPEGEWIAPIIGRDSDDDVELFDTGAHLIRQIFPQCTLAWWEEASFYLGWKQHGGSGLGRTETELLAMPLDRIEREINRVTERRREEAEALRAAYAKPR